MPAAPESGLRWRKSTRSVSGDCVEVARTPSAVAVRDSKDPSGLVLWFSPDTWRTFIGAVRGGELDGR
jgi:hypothetical protein